MYFSDLHQQRVMLGLVEKKKFNNLNPSEKKVLMYLDHLKEAENQKGQKGKNFGYCSFLVISL